MKVLGRVLNAVSEVSASPVLVMVTSVLLLACILKCPELADLGDCNRLETGVGIFEMFLPLLMAILDGDSSRSVSFRLEEE